MKARKGTYLDVFTAAARDGIERAYCDGELVSTDDPPKLSRNQEHTIDLVVHAGKDARAFEQGDLERALRWGEGELKLRSPSGEEQLFSLSSACPVCGFSVPELDPRFFSFNTKQGRCERCEGEGTVEKAASARKTKKKKRGKPAAEAPEPERVACPLATARAWRRSRARCASRASATTSS